MRKHPLILALGLLLVLASLVSCSKTETPAETPTETKDPKANITRDCDLFSIDLPQNMSEFEDITGDVPGINFLSHARNAMVCVAYVPKEWAPAQTLEDWIQLNIEDVQNYETTTLLSAGVEQSKCGNPYIRFEMEGEKLWEHQELYFETERCFVSISLSAEKSVVEAFRPKFEAWEESISWNETPTYRLLRDEDVFYGEDYTLTIGKGFVEANDGGYLNYDLTFVVVDFVEKQGTPQEALAGYANSINLVDVDESDVTIGENGNYSAWNTLTYDNKEFTVYLAVMETENQYAIFRVEALTELLEVYRPEILKWEAALVLQGK